jgi:LacI family transcriptional regulator
MAGRKKASAKKVTQGRDGSGDGAKGEFLPPRPISLRTLGDYLDLSPATISLVLNNAPGVRSIPQETRDRVIAAAKKFEYRPSFFARSLRRRQSFSVGVLVPELSDGYSVLVMNGIEEVLIEEGYFYLTASHRRKADLIEEYPGLLMDRSVEGFIAIDTALQHSLPLPVVAVAAHKPLPGVTRIILDHARAAELTLRHLYQLGHRQIAFMRGQTFSSDSDGGEGSGDRSAAGAGGTAGGEFVVAGAGLSGDSEAAGGEAAVYSAGFL